MPYRLNGRCVERQTTGSEWVTEKCHDSVELAKQHLAALQINVAKDEYTKAIRRQTHMASTFQKMLDFAYRLFTNEESGIKVIGNNWFARYSNAFQDREKEFFPIKGIDQYIDRVDTGVIPAPQLWVWHTPIVVGKAKAVARIEKFVVAVGEFADTPLGQAAKIYLSRRKAKLSHGFVFDKDTYKDGAYWDFNTFEISILPFERGVEANAYTNFEVKDMTISKDKEKLFVDMFGEDTAKELIANTNKASKALEEVGIQFKDFTNVGALRGKAVGDDTEEKPDDEKPNGAPAPDDEEEKKKKALAEAGWKSLVTDIMGDVAEVAEGQLALSKEVNGLRQALDATKKDYDARIAAQKKDFDARLEKLQAENKALKDELALTPRGTRASQSEETEVADKDLKEKLESKEKGKSDDFWGFAKDKPKQS